MRGTLIVVEGADSSGKATQTAMLIERLEADGFDVETLDFPQYDSFFGKHVAKFLRGEYGGLDEVHPEFASMLFAFDRWGQSPKIEQWLHAGKIVVLNRYMESNMAHQGAKIENREKRMAFIDWLHELEVRELGIPTADIVVYLHVPTEVSQELIRQRGDKDYLKGKKKDINEEDLEYQKRCVDTYIQLSEEMPSWQLVECTDGEDILSREAIHEKVYRVVDGFLKQRSPKPTNTSD